MTCRKVEDVAAATTAGLFILSLVLLVAAAGAFMFDVDWLGWAFLKSAAIAFLLCLVSAVVLLGVS